MVAKKNMFAKFDSWFLVLVLSLVFLGLVVLWSASTPESQQNFGNTTGYLLRQFTKGALIGLFLMFVVSKIDYHKLAKWAVPAIFASLVLLILVKVPGISFTANGASRWISVGPIIFQPAELSKFASILFLAAWLTSSKRDYKKFTDWLPPLVLIALQFALIITQPDLGTALSLVLASAAVVIVAGIPWKYFFWLGAAGLTTVLGLIIAEPYRMQRITAFLHPSSDPLGIGYQINQALIAVGSGGLLGYGYGLSRQKYFYLPEAITDSIFAVMAEELGFIRVILILLLFAALIFRGLYISFKAPDKFGQILGTGIIGLLAVNVIINIGAIMAIFPLTGIPLPFFSYGSSAMIINLIACGVLLNISRQMKQA